jgi:peptidyl-prolyl cis-trans isomerase SurA
VENQVANALYMSRMEPAIRDYLNKMRDNSSISITSGYNDSGATPAELSSNISFSTYTPPAPKKKEHVERTRFRETGHSFRNTTPEKTTVQAAAPAPSKSTKKDRKLSKKEEATVERPGKKEKIRFGQKPRETLPSAATNESNEPTIEDAGALPESASAGQEPVNPLDTQAPDHKTRFSERAKEHKDKKQEKPAQTEFNAAPPSAAEVANRQVQSASLGLDGNTSDKKKKKQTTKGKKERYSQQTKKPEDQQPVFTPAAPVIGAPAPEGTPKQEPSSTSTPQPQQ